MNIQTNKIVELIVYFRYIFEYDMVYSIQKVKLYKIVAQYIKNLCHLNTYSNKLKTFLKRKWLEVELSFNTSLSENTVQSNFICGNQLLLEFNIFTFTVN